MLNALRELVSATLLVEFKVMQLTIALKNIKITKMTISLSKFEINLKRRLNERENHCFTCEKPE